MATAVIIKSTTTYSPSSQALNTHYPHINHTPTIAEMIPPTEARRHSDPSEVLPHRQSLPSISEVISSTTSTSSGFPPTSVSATQSLSPFPPSFATQPRPYGESQAARDKVSSRSTHTPSYGRPEPLVPFVESPRNTTFNPPSGPPNPAPFGPHPSTTIKQDQSRFDSDKTSSDQHPNGSYSQPVPLAPYSVVGQLSNAHSSLSLAYPMSPRHIIPPLPPPFESQRALRAEETEPPHTRPRYDLTLNRHIEAWSYQECLSRVSHPHVRRPVFLG